MRRQHLILMAIMGVALVLGFGTQVQAHPDEGCALCHTPHNGYGDNSSVPLWNPEHTTTTLTDYYQGGATLNATLSAPDGASKLCLSCHDGSYEGMGAAHKFGNDANLAVNGMGSLTNSHPVSFTYDAALVSADTHLKDPTTLDKDVLDKNGKMHCTSCHQVHKHASRQETSNLRWAYTGSNQVIGGVTYGPTYLFCTHCHAK